MPDDPFDEVQDMILEDAGKMFSPRVVDLFMEPRNLGIPESFDHYSVVEGACGETLVMYISVDEGKIGRINFVTDGCGPTLACVSAVSCLAKGLSLTEALNLTTSNLIDYLGGLPPDKTQCAEVALKALRSVLLKAFDGTSPGEKAL